jgi:hypothetical protein
MAVVARRLPVLGAVNAGKCQKLSVMGSELDRVWARFAGAKTAHLTKRQIRDRLMAEHAPAGVGVPQRLWRATVEDTVDKIRAWQQAVIATEVRPKSMLAPATTSTSADGCWAWRKWVAGVRTHGCHANAATHSRASGRGRGARVGSWPTTAPTT